MIVIEKICIFVFLSLKFMKFLRFIYDVFFCYSERDDIIFEYAIKLSQTAHIILQYTRFIHKIYSRKYNLKQTVSKYYNSSLSINWVFLHNLIWCIQYANVSTRNAETTRDCMKLYREIVPVFLFYHRVNAY